MRAAALVLYAVFYGFSILTFSVAVAAIATGALSGETQEVVGAVAWAALLPLFYLGRVLMRYDRKRLV